MSLGMTWGLGFGGTRGDVFRVSVGHVFGNALFVGYLWGSCWPYHVGFRLKRSVKELIQYA